MEIRLGAGLGIGLGVRLVTTTAKLGLRATVGLRIIIGLGATLRAGLVTTTSLESRLTVGLEIILKSRIIVGLRLISSIINFKSILKSECRIIVSSSIFRMIYLAPGPINIPFKVVIIKSKLIVETVGVSKLAVVITVVNRFPLLA